jgi:hypothetical protein
MGNAVSKSHVTEEVVNVGKEVVIGEVVIGFLKIKLAVAQGLTKNHISRLPYWSVRGRVPEVHNARRDGADPGRMVDAWVVVCMLNLTERTVRCLCAICI